MNNSAAVNDHAEPQTGNWAMVVAGVCLLGCIGAGVTWWWNSRINQLMTQSIAFWGKGQPRSFARPGVNDL